MREQRKTRISQSLSYSGCSHLQLWTTQRSLVLIQTGLVLTGTGLASRVCPLPSTRELGAIHLAARWDWLAVVWLPCQEFGRLFQGPSSSITQPCRAAGTTLEPAPC